MGPMAPPPGDGPATSEPTASLVIVGNEILTCKVQDQNTPFLLERLRALGVPVVGVTVVPDVPARMVRAYRWACAEATWVFSTGGVGPTHDDVTMEAVAETFGRGLYEEPELAGVIRDFFKDRCTPAHLKMARLPEGCELVWGEGLRFPVVRVENLFVFPGQPGLMRAKFLGIEERFRCTPFELRRIYLKADEGQIAALLEAAEGDHPGVQVGSYPVFGTFDHNVLITVEGRDLAQVEAAARRISEGVPTEWLIGTE